jgi:hypothetical protein
VKDETCCSVKGQTLSDLTFTTASSATFVAIRFMARVEKTQQKD